MVKPHRRSRAASDTRGRRGAVPYRGAGAPGQLRAPDDVPAAGSGKRAKSNAPELCPVCDAVVPTCYAAFTDREAGIWSAQTRIVSRHRAGGGRATPNTDVCAGSETKVDEGRRQPRQRPGPKPRVESEPEDDMRDRKMEVHCGSNAGATRHLANGEKVCPACKAAKAEYDKRNRAIPDKRRRARLHAEAQSLAFRSLMQIHPEEYDALYEAYKRDIFEDAGLEVPRRQKNKKPEPRMPKGWKRVDE